MSFPGKKNGHLPWSLISGQAEKVEGLDASSLSGASTRVEIDQFRKKIWTQHRPNVFEPWDIWRRALCLITGAHFVPIYRLCSVKLDFSQNKLAYCDSIHRFLLKMLQKMKFSTNSNYVFAFIFNSVLSWQGFWHVILRELGPEYFPILSQFISACQNHILVEIQISFSPKYV